MELKPIYEKSGCSVGSLLIVPYGIETEFQNDLKIISGPFNRTLWN